MIEYKITVDRDSNSAYDDAQALLRAVMADKLCGAIWDILQSIRRIEKHSDNPTFDELAKDIREIIVENHDINIDELWS